ncbi:MAG: serine/threonine-protein kinase, partial [Anaerolineales bacterium]|nr:serine/threonine-protein kinase [Anaerolineales bacterium]
VYDVGDEDGQPYFVMRYMTGGSLTDWIEKGKFSIQDTARLIEKIAPGLAYSHKKGIVHRDLKPDNILFDDNGAPFISDFGVAKLIEASGGLTGSGVIGTPAYMSPEQVQGGEIDGRSDVYGLGVIVYQMLSGQQPYSADTPMGVVVKHITEPVPEILKFVPSLPPAVDEIIKTAMAKDKSNRYSTTIDLAKALNLLAFGNEGNMTAGTNTVKGTSWANLITHSSRSILGLAVVGIVLVVAVIGFFIVRNQLLSPDQPNLAQSADSSSFTTVPTAGQAASPAFASFCSSDVSIPVPDVKETNSTCIKKDPYSFISIPEGAVFEVLNPEGSCKVETVSGGKQLLLCTGPDFLVMDVKICTPPVLSDADLDKCSSEATFDSANQCCVTVPPQEAGCTVPQISLKGCE